MNPHYTMTAEEANPTVTEETVKNLNWECGDLRTRTQTPSAIDNIFSRYTCKELYTILEIATEMELVDLADAVDAYVLRVHE